MRKMVIASQLIDWILFLLLFLIFTTPKKKKIYIINYIDLGEKKKWLKIVINYKNNFWNKNPSMLGLFSEFFL